LLLKNGRLIIVLRFLSALTPAAMPFGCLKMPLQRRKYPPRQRIRDGSVFFGCAAVDLQPGGGTIGIQLFCGCAHFGQHFGDEILTEKPGLTVNHQHNIRQK